MNKLINSRIVHILLLIMAVCFVYANSLGGEFVFDDKAMIAAYDLVKDINNLPKAFVSATSVYGNVNYYRPLQTVSYMTDYFLWGNFTAGFHATNIIFHAMGAVLAYLLLLLLFGDALLAFAASILFAVHPVNGSIVAYIAGRADAMVLSAILASLIFYVRSRYAGGGRTCYVLSLIFFALALLTKETAMMVPLVVIFFDKYGRKWTALRKGKPGGGAEYLPFLAILGVYIWFRFANMSFFVEGAAIPPPFAYRLMTVPYVLGQYLRLAILPNDLHIGREIWVAMSPLDPRVVISAAVVAGVFYWGYRVRPQQKAVWFGLVWFALMMAPSLNVITPLFYTLADNWMYIPSIGLYLALAATGKMIYERISRSALPAAKYAVVLAFAAFVLALGFVAVGYNRTWQNEIAVGMNTIKFNPFDHKVYNNMGVYYLGKGEFALAEQSFQKCLEIKPDTGMAYFNLYRVYSAQGKRQAALECLAKAKKMDPARVNILIEKMGIKD
jgi:hypothetical protein